MTKKFIVQIVTVPNHTIRLQYGESLASVATMAENLGLTVHCIRECDSNNPGMFEDSGFEFGFDHLGIAAYTGAPALEAAAPAPAAVTPQEIADFVQAVSDRVYATGKATYPTCEANWNRVEFTCGPKYAKLVSRSVTGSACSVYCFIELATGDIYKAAGFNKPAKHARGNIREGDASNWWKGALTVYGAAYLR
jgi:hypothetical protein